MRMMWGFMGGAVGLGLVGQLAGGDAARMIEQEMGAVNVDPMLKTAVEQANNALGSGLTSPWVIVTVAAMPVILHVVKGAVESANREHRLSVAKRRKDLGLDGEHEA